MRTISHYLASTGLVLLAALAVTPAGAADLDVDLRGRCRHRLS